MLSCPQTLCFLNFDLRSLQAGSLPSPLGKPLNDGNEQTDPYRAGAGHICVLIPPTLSQFPLVVET